MNEKQFSITVNGRHFAHDSPTITGNELLQLVGLHHSSEYEILLRLNERESEPVELTETVDLARHQEAAFTIKPYPEAVIELDDETIPFTEIFMTPVEIMLLADYKDSEYYLKQVIGHQEITYKDDKQHVIALHDRIKFVTCKIANTTVS